MKDLTEIRNKKHHSGAWVIKQGAQVEGRLKEILESSFLRKVELTDVQMSSGNRVVFSATVVSRKQPIMELAAFTLLETEEKKITGEMVIESHFESSYGYCPVLVFGSYVRVYYK